MRILIPVIAASILLLTSCKDDFEDNITDVRQARLQAITDSMRLVTESAIGKPIPNLNVLVQTSTAFYFLSSASNSSGKITPDTWFRFASFTKNMTATAILNMHEDGWLNIDDRITDSMPGSAISYVPNSSGWNIPYKNNITIRQLLSHTAGVYDSDNDTVPGLGGMSYTKYMLQSDPNHQFTTSQYVAQNAQYALSYFAPGTGYHYSNTGYSMLAEIISRVYSFQESINKTYADYMYEVILPGTATIQPGTIKFPYLATDQSLPTPSVFGVTYYGNNIFDTTRNYNSSCILGDGHGIGTMRSVNAFFRTTQRGDGVLLPATVNIMNTPPSPDFSSDSYGLGTQSFGEMGRGHGGNRTGYNTLVMYDRFTGISMVGMLPIFDLSDGRNSLINNCVQNLGLTMYLLREELFR